MTLDEWREAIGGALAALDKEPVPLDEADAAYRAAVRIYDAARVYADACEATARPYADACAAAAYIVLLRARAARLAAERDALRV